LEDSGTSQTVLRRYYYGSGIDEPICLIVVNGQNETKYYYHFDGLGSVVALSNDNNEIVGQRKGVRPLFLGNSKIKPPTLFISII